MDRVYIIWTKQMLHVWNWKTDTAIFMNKSKQQICFSLALLHQRYEIDIAKLVLGLISQSGFLTAFLSVTGYFYSEYIYRAVL